MRRRQITILLLSCSLLSTPAAHAINIEFDYTYDTSGFFNDPARRDALSQAAQAFAPFTDSLSAITPVGGKVWDATFADPSNGAPVTLHNPTVPADTLIVFVGARPLPAGAIGDSRPGSATGTGDAAWLTAVATRGQAGATAERLTSTDFGPWGGSLSFNSSLDWLPPGSPSPSYSYSILYGAIHELAHVLGFGSAPSFLHYTSGDYFIGPTAYRYTYFRSFDERYVPLAPDLNHWADFNTPYGAPALITSSDSLRFYTPLTPVDLAALYDIGWQVPLPAPYGSDGDYTLDQVVDLSDLNQILNEFRGGAYDLTDLNNVLNHFGSDYRTVATSVIPEPAVVALLLPLVPLMVRRRRSVVARTKLLQHPGCWDSMNFVLTSFTIPSY